MECVSHTTLKYLNLIVEMPLSAFLGLSPRVSPREPYTPAEVVCSLHPV